jgi:hypothetical protein
MIKSSDLRCKIEAFQIKSKGLGDHATAVSFGAKEYCQLKINLRFQVAIVYGIDNVTFRDYFFVIMQDYTFLITYK